MGVKIARQKSNKLWLSIIYKIQRHLPLSKNKLKLFLNLEWIFDRLSNEMSYKYYKPENHPARQSSKAFVLDNISSENTVLDLGCNKGDFSYMISEKAGSVIGIDHDNNFIEIAKQRNQRANLKFIHGDALEFLKSNSKRFDILILAHLLEHIDDPKDFLNLFKDYFNRIYIELPDFDRNYLNHYRKDLNLELIYTDNDHVSEFSRDELQDILTSCNIVIEKAEYIFGVQKLWCKVLR